MNKLGNKQMIVELKQPVATVPAALAEWALELSADGCQLTYTYDPHNPRTGIAGLLQAVSETGLRLKDVHTTQSSLEEIFVGLVRGDS